LAGKDRQIAAALLPSLLEFAYKHAVGLFSNNAGQENLAGTLFFWLPGSLLFKK
jgi:hypothetical protein